MDVSAYFKLLVNSADPPLLLLHDLFPLVLYNALVSGLVDVETLCKILEYTYQLRPLSSDCHVYLEGLSTIVLNHVACHFESRLTIKSYRIFSQQVAHLHDRVFGVANQLLGAKVGLPENVLQTKHLVL